MKHFPQKLAARLAALLIVFSALLPQGTMLARDAESGLIEITICSGVSSRVVLFNPETGEYVDEAGSLDRPAVEIGSNHAEDTAPCPFAVAGDSDHQRVASSCADVESPVTHSPAGPSRSLAGPASTPLPPRGPPAYS